MSSSESVPSSGTSVRDEIGRTAWIGEIDDLDGDCQEIEVRWSEGFPEFEWRSEYANIPTCEMPPLAIRALAAWLNAKADSMEAGS